jgi:hypothetical protein
MKTNGILVSAYLLLAATSSVFAQAPAPPPDTSAAGSTGVSKALREIDDRALPFLSKWTVCEAQVQKIVQQYFKTIGRDPGPDLGKISIMGEPKRNGRYEIYLVKCGSAVAVKKELDETMLQGVRDLLAQPVGEEGEEKYCHDFVSQSSVGGKVSSEIQQKVGIGENNFRMPTGGRQYISLSLFEQFLRVGATNWWIQNFVGNDALGLPFWHAGEGRVVAGRPLIDNPDNATRRVVPNLLKFHAGFSYRLTEDVETRSFLTNIIPPRRLNLNLDGRIVGGMQAFIPLGEDMKASVFGVNVNAELAFNRVPEDRAINQTQIAKPRDINRTIDEVGLLDRGFEVMNDLRNGVQQDPRNPNPLLGAPWVATFLRNTAQLTFFYSWWLDNEGSENPPDNIFRVDAGINYMEFQEAALVRRANDAGSPLFLRYNGVRGLNTIRPSSVLDWVFLKFEYRNETTFPFGASAQYSNQTLLLDGYFPVFGNWLYLEVKYARILRPLLPFEPPSSDYFMVSPVFRILIPR